jgi:hypothetical protein
MSFKSIPSTLMVVTLQMFFSACAGEMQVVRAPFISPVVVPAPASFKMNAVVKNGSTVQQGGWDLFVYTEYGPPGQFNNSNQHMFKVPSLSPNQSWAISDFDITNGNTQVPCLKDQCEGHSWLVLCPYAAPSWNSCNVSKTWSAPRCVHVWWKPSGNLADMQVKDC